MERDYSSLYNTLVDHPDLLICRWLPDTSLTFVNDTYARFYGYEKSEMIGKKWLEISKVDIQEDLRFSINRAEALKDSIVREDPAIDPEGKERWVRWYNRPIIDDSGAVVEFQSIGVDITDQRQTTQKLLESEREMSLVLDNIEELVAYHRPDLSLVWMNRAYARSCDSSQRDLTGKLCHEIWYGSKQPCENCSVALAVRERRNVTGEITSGERVWHIKAYPVFGQDGGLLGVVDFSYEITEERKLSEELVRSEERFKRLVNSTDDIIFELDKEGRHTAIHGRWLEKMGFSEEFFLGRSAGDIFSAEDALVHEQNNAIALGGESTKYEWSAEVDGVYFFYSTSLSPIFDQEGNVTGIVGIGRDITDIKRAEEALRRSWDQLILTMSRMLRIKDPYTAGHQERVKEIAGVVSEEMGLSLKSRETIRIASLLHDIGKLAIPADILNRPGKLNEIEWGLIKQHPEQGFELLKDIDFGMPVAEVVRQHHERIDGSGYLLGLKGEEILIEARVLAVADVFEAISSHRPYRASLGVEEAVAELEKNSGVLYDPKVVDALLRVIERGFVFDTGSLE